MSNCEHCGQRHELRGKPTCSGHVTTDRDSYVPGQDRKPLDKPRPCRRWPNNGQTKCGMHGGSSPQAKAAGEQREAEAKARAAIVRKLGDAGEQVSDPIGKLCAIAGRAVAFMEALAGEIDKLERVDADGARALITLYGRAIKDAASIVESIIRMGIAERLAKAEEQQTAVIVAFIDGVLADLGHNPRDPEVAGVVTRRLELVAS
ncbi:MAG TPA: hypothetical protein VHZ96_26240 [Frankiaceae bacterium]|nr:hypothetical protein [Frankiaceae bacterium]